MDPDYRKHHKFGQEFDNNSSGIPVTHMSKVSVSKLRKVTFDKVLLTYGPKYGNIFYFIRLVTNSTHLGSSSLIRPAIHSVNAYPYISLSLAPIIRRIKREDLTAGMSGLQDINKFYMQYYMVTSWSLPAPYTTRCLYRSQSECVRRCLSRKIMKSLGKLPFNVITKQTAPDEQMNCRLVSSIDVRNVSIGKMVKNAEKDCSIHGCKGTDCKFDFTLTSTRVTSSLNQDFLQFQVMAPEDLFVRIEAIPQMLFNDYLLLSMALLDLWMGLSVYTILHAIIPWVDNLFEKRKKSPENEDEKELRRTKIIESDFCRQTRRHLRGQLDKNMASLTRNVMGILEKMETR